MEVGKKFAAQNKLDAKVLSGELYCDLSSRYLYRRKERFISYLARISLQQKSARIRLICGKCLATKIISLNIL